MIERKPDTEEIRRSLAEQAEAVALHYIGETPNKALSSRAELRFGRKGSLAIRIDGPKAGKWSDFSSGEHGDLLDLIQRATGGGDWKPE